MFTLGEGKTKRRGRSAKQLIHFLDQESLERTRLSLHGFSLHKLQPIHLVVDPHASYCNHTRIYRRIFGVRLRRE